MTNLAILTVLVVFQCQLKKFIVKTAPFGLAILLDTYITSRYIKVHRSVIRNRNKNITKIDSEKERRKSQRYYYISSILLTFAPGTISEKSSKNLVSLHQGQSLLSDRLPHVCIFPTMFPSESSGENCPLRITFTAASCGFILVGIFGPPCTREKTVRLVYPSTIRLTERPRKVETEVGTVRQWQSTAVNCIIKHISFPNDPKQ
ncbi:hypothetical protein WN51_10370 [Melipona quadrifasciata]|uniref:Uncharacterized protein n=1 Tax=Melipona quadrifasciata TaxID=166423 RepID=A0A0N0BJ42_9HYME|nr:hypothetical protein WN51_10370 [Melipona quadrifasciata]